MCMLCIELIKQRITIPEAEKAALEMIVDNPYYLMDEKKLEHIIDLLESIQDMDLDRLNDTLDRGDITPNRGEQIEKKNKAIKKLNNPSDLENRIKEFLNNNEDEDE